MRILDENGRLFGKINVVDLAIITLLLIMIPGFFQIYKILGKRPIAIKGTWIKIEAVTFAVPEFTDFFKPGDISYAENGNPQARLLRIVKKGSNYGSNIKKSMLSRGGNVKYEYWIPVFLEFDLLCTKSEKDKTWYYRRAPLLVSMKYTFDFVTERYSMRCYVLKIKD